MRRCVIQSRCAERRTFVYHNPSPREIVYYISENATYVCFDDRESAEKLVNRSYRLRKRHPRVLPAESHLYHPGLKKHLVCFDRFDGFLPQADQEFLARLMNPNSSHSVPGNPNEFVQLEIKELIKALEHMHDQGVSSKSLHLPIGYVWSRGELKIIMLDVEDRQEHTSEQWNKIIARDVQHFGTGLDTYFLNTDVVWPQKDSFFRCFSMRLLDEKRRLPMILNHPFLKNNISEIFKIFTRVHRDLRAADPSDGDVLQLRKLMVALNGGQFKSEFMPNGVWTRQEMSPQFNAFLRGNCQHPFLRGNCQHPSNSVKYNTEDMGDLLRFLRNLYENGHENNIRVLFMFEEVGRYWPHLIDRFHEKIAALPGMSWY